MNLKALECPAWKVSLPGALATPYRLTIWLKVEALGPWWMAGEYDSGELPWVHLAGNTVRCHTVGEIALSTTPGKG